MPSLRWCQCLSLRMKGPKKKSHRCLASCFVDCCCCYCWLLCPSLLGGCDEEMGCGSCNTLTASTVKPCDFVIMVLVSSRTVQKHNDQSPTTWRSGYRTFLAQHKHYPLSPQQLSCKTLTYILGFSLQGLYEGHMHPEGIALSQDKPVHCAKSKEQVQKQ